MPISNGFTSFHRPSKSEYNIYRQLKHRLNRRAKQERGNKWRVLEVASHVVGGTNYYFKLRNSSNDTYILLVYLPLPNEDRTQSRIISLKRQGQ